MKFTYTEMDGEHPITDWLAYKIKQYILEKTGMDVRVEVISELEEPREETCKGGCSV